ncbi:hypothetical protein HYV85_05965 [Candidatus Woesearchaeota archaeon]|nr:hypothetical protein [Candidatus Woesearchaeota archaeon]
MTKMAKIGERVEDILRAKSAQQKAWRFIVTCVDPKYPARSLGEECQEADVWYDDSHVQQAGDSKQFRQLFLVYDAASNSFKEITKDSVNENLPKGVVQLALGEGTRESTIVMGIPGDAYAFVNGKEGTGFAFGKPNGAAGDVAQAVLMALVQYCSAKASAAMRIWLMAHPDCGLFANNVGKFLYAEAAWQLLKGQHFIGSEYQSCEASEKLRGIVAVARMFPDATVHAVRPAYQERKAGIVKALEGAH